MLNQCRVAAFAASTVLLMGCPSEKQADKPTEAQAPAAASSVAPVGRQQQLSMDLPEGWKALPRKDGETASRIVSPDEKRMLSVERLRKRILNAMTEDYAQHYLADYAKQAGPNLTWAEPLKPMSSNGLKWFKAGYDIKAPKGDVVIGWAITSNEGIPYIFTYADLRGKRTSEFDLLLAGISFK